MDNKKLNRPTLQVLSPNPLTTNGLHRKGIEYPFDSVIFLPKKVFYFGSFPAKNWSKAFF